MGGSLGGMQALAWSYLQYPQRIAPLRGDRHRRPSSRRRTSPSTRSRARAIAERSGLPRRRLLRLGRGAQARPARGAHDRPHHLPVGRRHGGEVRPRAARPALDEAYRLLLRRRVRGRELPALPGRQVLRVLRRQHLPADHARARLLRPGAHHRRRPRQGARAGAGELLPRLVHHRLALPAGALARDRRGADRQRPRGRLCGDRCAARPRCVPARRPAATTRSCGRISTTSRAKSAPGRHDARSRRATSRSGADVPPQALPLRSDLAIIAGWIAPGSRVLDLGCGDGALLAHLRDARSCRGYGVDIDDAERARVRAPRRQRRRSRDLDVGLRMFTDGRSTPWCCRRRCRRCTASRTCCARWRASRARAS